jgi:hypothetical protein
MKNPSPQEVKKAQGSRSEKLMKQTRVKQRGSSGRQKPDGLVKTEASEIEHQVLATSQYFSHRDRQTRHSTKNSLQ